jgi:hypothetical protein
MTSHKHNRVSRPPDTSISLLTLSTLTNVHRFYPKCFPSFFYLYLCSVAFNYNFCNTFDFFFSNVSAFTTAKQCTMVKWNLLSTYQETIPLHYLIEWISLDRFRVNSLECNLTETRLLLKSKALSLHTNNEISRIIMTHQISSNKSYVFNPLKTKRISFI